MIRRVLTLVCTFALGAIVGHVAIPSSGVPFAEHGVVMAQTRNPMFMTRLYTGPDNQTHAEDIEVKFAPGSPNEVSKMLPVTGAELHRGAPGGFSDWHPGPRRQYVITLSGHGELELAGGKKIAVGPGHIELIEDTTGKGHITRITGTEDRVTLFLPLADQSTR
jgi:quercetin dioxygenase-like cupin family protein